MDPPDAAVEIKVPSRVDEAAAAPGSKKRNLKNRLRRLRAWAPPASLELILGDGDAPIDLSLPTAGCVELVGQIHRHFF